VARVAPAVVAPAVPVPAAQAIVDADAASNDDAETPLPPRDSSAD
jgi:hypothetical protein